MKRRDFIGASLGLAAAWPMRSLAEALKGLGDLPARTLTGNDVLLKGSSVEALSASLRGEVLVPGNGGYDAARRIWNAMFDRKPALIVRCTGAADVIEAVNFAREHQLLTAVRSGGHSMSGKSNCDGGIMIDMAPMQGCRVDPVGKRAYLEAGSLLGQLDRESQAFGLATTAGTVSHTGAAGLTLGGGLGRLGRRFGLACDNVAAYDIVTADGRLLHVTESEHPGLHWGLRGGGGNFGVVTAFEYRLHPLDSVILAGQVTWPLEQGRDVLRMYVEQARAAPDGLNLSASLMAAPDGKGVVNIEVCWSGDHAKGEAAIKALRAFGKPLKDGVGPMKYVALQSSGDGGAPWGLNYYAKNGFLLRLDNAGIDLLIDTLIAAPGRFRFAIDHGGGAYDRVAPDGSAYWNRGAAFWVGMLGGWKDPAESEERIAVMRASWKRIAPITSGFYNNLAGEATDAEQRANYGGNFDRLVALKAKYDPMNLFRLNANIPVKA